MAVGGGGVVVSYRNTTPTPQSVTVARAHVYSYPPLALAQSVATDMTEHFGEGGYQWLCDRSFDRS